MADVFSLQMWQNFVLKSLWFSIAIKRGLIVGGGGNNKPFLETYNAFKEQVRAKPGHQEDADDVQLIWVN